MNRRPSGVHNIQFDAPRPRCFEIGGVQKTQKLKKKVNEHGIGIGLALLVRSPSFHPFGPVKGVYVERRVSWRSSTLVRTSDFQDEPEDFFYFQQRVRENPDEYCQKERKAQQQAVCYSLVCNCELKSLGLVEGGIARLETNISGKHARRSVKSSGSYRNHRMPQGSRKRCLPGSRVCPPSLGHEDERGGKGLACPRAHERLCVPPN